MLAQTVRRATEGDVLAISTLVLSGSFDGTGIEGTSEELDAWRRENASTSLIRGRIIQDLTLLLVSEGNNGTESLGLCGTGYGSITSPLEAYIGGVYCSVRRQGIGRSIIEELLRWLDQNHVQNIEMTIAHHNFNMKKLASKLGFRKEGEFTSDRFYKTGTFEIWFLRHHVIDP